MSHGRSPCPLGTTNCHTTKGLDSRNGFVSPTVLGLDSWDDTKALRQWIMSAAAAPQPPSLQDRARTVVRAFAARAGGGAFVNIARDAVANGLLQRIDHPESISQGGSSLCGPAALLFNLATRDPVAYAGFVINLYEKGTARMRLLKITPGKDLLGYDPKGRIDPADWIPLASLRDSQNWFFDYQAVDDEFAGITLPNHLASWFKKIGFAEVINDTNLVATKDRRCIEEAARRYRDDFWVCLFVNAQVLSPDEQEARSATPDHWIVLTSDVTFGGGNIAMTVFTWGVGHRAIPFDPARPLSVAHFLRNFYGYVAARY